MSSKSIDPLNCRQFMARACSSGSMMGQRLESKHPRPEEFLLLAAVLTRYLEFNSMSIMMQQAVGKVRNFSGGDFQ